MSTSPLISVVIPVYNGERFLAETLNSVLAQTYRPLEIIVVDDGSTDYSSAVAQSFGEVRYLYMEHGGLGAALNHGISHATGDFFALLDADDLWVDTKLSKQMACFDADPTLEAVFSHLVHFRAGTPHEWREMEGYFKSTMLIRRDAFSRVGLFNTQWRVGDFIDWYLRAHEKGIKSRMLDQVLLKRRVHDNNMSVREREHRKAYLQILKQSLNRRQQNT